MKRYTVEGSWTIESIDGPVITETADIRDTRTGVLFREGAWRVRFTRPVEGFRGRTFYGETAWQSAQRLARDAGFAAARNAR